MKGRIYSPDSDSWSCVACGAPGTQEACQSCVDIADEAWRLLVVSGYKGQWLANKDMPSLEAKFKEYWTGYDRANDRIFLLPGVGALFGSRIGVVHCLPTIGNYGDAWLFHQAVKDPTTTERHVFYRVVSGLLEELLNEGAIGSMFAVADINSPHMDRGLGRFIAKRIAKTGKYDATVDVVSIHTSDSDLARNVFGLIDAIFSPCDDINLMKRDEVGLAYRFVSVEALWSWAEFLKSEIG